MRSIVLFLLVLTTNAQAEEKATSEVETLKAEYVSEVSKAMTAQRDALQAVVEAQLTKREAAEAQCETAKSDYLDATDQLEQIATELARVNGGAAPAEGDHITTVNAAYAKKLGALKEALGEQGHTAGLIAISAGKTKVEAAKAIEKAKSEIAAIEKVLNPPDPNARPALDRHGLGSYSPNYDGIGGLIGPVTFLPQEFAACFPKEVRTQTASQPPAGEVQRNLQ